jgi:hypothetical protein
VDLHWSAAPKELAEEEMWMRLNLMEVQVVAMVEGAEAAEIEDLAAENFVEVLAMAAAVVSAAAEVTVELLTTLESWKAEAALVLD